MKKIILLLIISTTLFSFTYIKTSGYITLFENSGSAKYFKYGNSSYFEYFDNNRITFDEKEYYIRYRKYGWGDIDTAYYRKGTKNYYHFDKKNMVESIVLPIEPKIGDKWFEKDKSWSYEVIEENQKFKTPAKKYKNCVKVYCKQLTNKNKEKSKEYYLFYSSEYGYVGNVNSKGKILSYLSEMKLNAKNGDKIGDE